MKKHIFFAAAAAVSAFAAFLATSCDSANGYDIEVTPVYSEVRSEGQRVTLSATGWDDYEWSLSRSDIGYLSSRHGETVVYTATRIPVSLATGIDGSVTSVARETQTVTVKGRNIPSSSSSTGSGSNTVVTTSAVYSGTATITHVGRK